MNGQNGPVTRGELRQELGELRQELAALEERLESRLVGRMRDTETALLTAFHSYATGVQIEFPLPPTA